MCLICLKLAKSIMHVLIFDVIYEVNISPGIAYLSSFPKDYTYIFYYSGFSQFTYLTVFYLSIFSSDFSLNGM